jgi:murein DD-endopeptidase MepM/ murein hydrolase activator NlpD
VRRNSHCKPVRTRKFSNRPAFADPTAIPSGQALPGTKGRRLGPRIGALTLTAAAAVALWSFGEASLPGLDWPPSTDTDVIVDIAEIPTPEVLADGLRLPVDPTLAFAPTVQEVVVENGDTLAAVLGKVDISRQQAHAAIDALRTVYDPRQLQIGQQIALTLKPNDAGPTLVGLELSSSFDRHAGITLYPDGSYRSFVTPKQLSKSRLSTGGVISSSLFGDGIEAGIPASTMSDFIRLFSFDVDFERDVQANDKFEVVYERYLDRDGEVVHTGDLLYAGFTVGGKERSYYRYSGGDGDDAYYDRDGNGIRKALLKTPVDNARRSSGFGMRRHPVLGYTKMHMGVDFAASTGTPIRAAGDGVISFAGRKGSYGNYVSIRHNGNYATAYAHMSKFARGIRGGKRVRQGQIIGYVGTTGRSTGPHLHYEVMLQGKRINPSALRLPSGQSLKGAELRAFQEQIAVIDALRRDQATATQVASRGE